jgi:hypothetical protein
VCQGFVRELLQYVEKEVVLLLGIFELVEILLGPVGEYMRLMQLVGYINRFLLIAVANCDNFIGCYRNHSHSIQSPSLFIVKERIRNNLSMGQKISIINWVTCIKSIKLINW